jgi:hypothetical protein
MNMDPAQVARQAAGFIAERGLAKGKLVDQDGKVCNNGALLLAMVGVPVLEEYIVPRGFHLIWNLLMDTEVEILRRQGIDAIRPWEYNDRTSTSAEDVILLLKQAAEALEESCSSR